MPHNHNSRFMFDWVSNREGYLNKRARIIDKVDGNTVGYVDSTVHNCIFVLFFGENMGMWRGFRNFRSLNKAIRVIEAKPLYKGNVANVEGKA